MENVNINEGEFEVSVTFKEDVTVEQRAEFAPIAEKLLVELKANPEGVLPAYVDALTIRRSTQA